MGSFLAKYDVQYAQDEGIASRVMRRLELYRRLGLAFAGRPPVRYSVADLEGMPGDTAKALVSFLDEIIEDHPLIHDLTPYAMGRLNNHLKHAPPARLLPVTNFISVAPPPSLHRADLRLRGGVNPFLRGLYATSHMETRLEANEFGPVLDGPSIGKCASFDGFSSTAQDGVVPAASQSFDGSVESYVYGDHLDVVGHYPSAKHGGETVFDSGADFDDSRLEELWGAVGAVIRRSSKATASVSGVASVGPAGPTGQPGARAKGGKGAS